MSGDCNSDSTDHQQDDDTLSILGEEYCDMDDKKIRPAGPPPTASRTHHRTATTKTERTPANSPMKRKTSRQYNKTPTVRERAISVSSVESPTHRRRSMGTHDSTPPSSQKAILKAKTSTATDSVCCKVTKIKSKKHLPTTVKKRIPANKNPTKNSETVTTPPKITTKSRRSRSRSSSKHSNDSSESDSSTSSSSSSSTASSYSEVSDVKCEQPPESHTQRRSPPIEQQVGETKQTSSTVPIWHGKRKRDQNKLLDLQDEEKTSRLPHKVVYLDEELEQNNPTSPLLERPGQTQPRRQERFVVCVPTVEETLVNSNRRFNDDDDHYWSYQPSTQTRGYQEYLLSMIKQKSPRLVFLHALIEDSACLAFAITSMNNIYEGAGVPYDMVDRRNTVVTTGRRSHMRKFLRNANALNTTIHPEDITKFIVSNVDFPILVGCDFDGLLSLNRRKRGLLNDCCHLTNLTPGNNDTSCTECIERASYVSAADKTPLCHQHAKYYHGELQMYQPMFLSMGTFTNGIRLNFLSYDPTASDPLHTARWLPLAYRNMRGNHKFTKRSHTNYAINLLDIAYNQRLEWRSDNHEDSLNVAKTLQILCMADLQRGEGWEMLRTNTVPL